MNKNIRFRLAKQMFRSSKLLKAIAMLLLIRKRSNSNIIKNFTINKIAVITGMHASTVKRRLRTLGEYGLVAYCGKSISFRSVTSKHKERNINITKTAYGKIKDVERSLQAILAAIIQLRKDFVKRTILTAHNGRNAKQVKSARKLSRRYRWGNQYVERGLGYEKIAKTIGCCKATAVKIIKFAENSEILRKKKNYKWFFMKGVNYLNMRNYGYTFTTKHYACVVMANTYSVAPCIAGGNNRD